MNIVKSFFILSLFFLLWACTNNSKKTLAHENILTPNENIRVLIDSFLKENKHDKYIYELYIDKIDPNNCNMILYAGEKSLTQKENKYYGQKSLACVVYKDVKIDIYSGIERYFKTPTDIDTISIQKGFESNANSILWAIRDSMGILSCYEIDGGYPFIPLPLKNKPKDFAPPNIRKFW